MVNLARMGQLNKGNSLYEGYVEKKKPLVVMFSPISWYYVLAYAEKVDDLASTMGCDVDGYIYDQLDTHWWICFHEWN